MLAVLGYHLDLAWTGGGFLGVEVFFTLSGFLITQLLLDELTQTGRVDAWAFTKARARRLLPALIACVLATLALFAWLVPAAGLRADGLAALLYVQNWHLVLAGLPYAEAFARPSPLLHLWSLSVEGQLYLLWPLLLVGVLALARRCTAVLVTILLAFASALLMALRYDPDGGSLAYYATDARASGFLVGAALAWVWRPPVWSRPLPRTARWGIDAAGILALVMLVVGFVTVSEFDAGLYLRGGFLWVGMLTAVLMVAATRGSGVLAALLSRPLIVAVGRRSYGLYLYHWPVFVLGRELPLPRLTINVLGVLVTVAVAEASYRWIETPVRRGGLAALMGRLGLSRPAAVVAFGAAMSALLATVVALSGPSDAAGDDPATAVAANSAGAAADLSGGGQAGAPGSSTCAATSGMAGPGVPAGQAARPGVPAGQAARPGVPAGQAAGPGVAAATGAGGGASGVGGAAGQACGAVVPDVVVPGVVAGAAVGSNGPGGAAGAPQPVPATPNPGGPRGAAGPALVVGDSIALGSADSLRHALGARTTVDAKVGRQFSAAPGIVAAWAALNDGPIVIDLGANGTVAADDVAAVLAAAGERRVVLVGVHVPRRWQDGNNNALRAAAAAHPGAAFVDWDALVEANPGVLGPDGVHLGAAGRTLLATAIAAAAGRS
jgi:peptidoglycan/LPS O-acetylase OafA/YrhL